MNLLKKPKLTDENLDKFIDLMKGSASNKNLLAKFIKNYNTIYDDRINQLLTASCAIHNYSKYNTYIFNEHWSIGSIRKAYKEYPKVLSTILPNTLYEMDSIMLQKGYFIDNNIVTKVDAKLIHYGTGKGFGILR